MKNPVSVIMECLTNKQWGHGIDPKNIDAEAFIGFRKPMPMLNGVSEHFTAERPKGMPWGGSSEQDGFVKGVDPEKLAVDTIRAKVTELNDAIATGAKFGISVEQDTLDRYEISTGKRVHITAEISKKL